MRRVLLRSDWIINCGEKYKNSMMNIRRHAESAHAWLKHPNAFVVKFEDLCGEKGGGSKIKQAETITNICRHLSISLTKEKLDYIVENLWGDSVYHSRTFRKGKRGAWKEAFLPIHKESFKKRMGQQLIDLEYETNFNW